MNENLNWQKSPDWLTAAQRKLLWGFVAAIVLLRVLIMLQMPLLETTEARYAEIARKMVETHDWVTPQFDYGVPFWGKPPLHTWLSAAGMKLFGVNHFGARIFILVAAGLMFWMLYVWARSIKGRDYALVGTAILASTTLYFLSSAYVMTDLVMAAGVSLSMAGFYAAVSKRPFNRLWGYLFFVGLGIGMLAKGPVAVVLAALPIGLWVLLGNRWVDTWKRLPWIEGTLLTCAIFMPWYVAAELKTPGFLEYFIVGEHLHRFLDSGWGGDLYGNAHSEPRGMIWLFWLAALLPWSFFLLLPLRWAGRLWHGIRGESDGWSLYLLCWALSPMLFFTLATNTIATYVITGLPAMSFLAIDLWRFARHSASTSGRGLVRLFGATAVVALCFFLGAYLVFLLELPAGVKKTEKYVVQQMDAMRGAESGGLYYFGKRRYSAEFYSGGRARTLGSVDQLAELLGNGERDFVCLRRGDLAGMSADFAERFELVQEFPRSVLYYERELRSGETTTAEQTRPQAGLPTNREISHAL